MVKRFAYDNNKKKCVKFYYGGCKGNKNNFESMEDCTWTCEQRLPKPQPEQGRSTDDNTPAQCPLKLDLAKQKYNDQSKTICYRFAYDNKKEKCIEFYYGGCKGNQNNFDTMEDCTLACEQRLPKPETKRGRLTVCAE
ncbi:Kunitz/Bovine pancreatic trypsin inhibitor domain protein [Ancylostoma duodenale]|uniref:Kunitz/Bovine pancreatic trypsin inhibitor domain protein n=1 Tax=Ancylostoma duodenale TaxID=51022 RepID=A0A0C2FJ43_9BILA|nr:Kunitz/Bovine pancreatic trypsin inhibitor domain protein [Ancylostoma duodenale]